MTAYPIPHAALAQHTAVLGKTGSGKTSTAKTIVEHVVPQGARVCVLDPIKSDWWGLTSSADGKRPGLPFHILGGPHGHVPLRSSSGKVIGELVATGALPLSILDLADFEAGGLQRFFTDFAPALLRKMRGVLYLVLEEAHEFAPKERSGIGNENLAIHWAKKLATAGRSSGVRLIIATQRTQALHNALLGSCETMIAHRLVAPADQKPVTDWLKANVKDKTLAAEIGGDLAALKTGTAWVCSGEAGMFERITFPRITTYDNSATPTSDTAAQQVRTAPVDVDRLRAIMGEAAKEFEENDPTKLKAEIARLKKDLAAKPQQHDKAAVDAAYQKGAEDGKRAVATAAAKREHELLTAIKAAARCLVPLIEVRSGEVPIAIDVRQLPPLNGHAVKPPAARPSPPKRAPSPAGGAGEALPRGERACLTAIAMHPGGVTRTRITVLTGYKRSTRDAYIQRLRERSHIEQDGERIVATGSGVAALGADYEPLPTGAALLDHWLERLPEGERRVLSVLAEAYPEAVDRSSIDEATGYKRSSRDAYIQRLSARELVASAGAGAVKAADELFGGA